MEKLKLKQDKFRKSRGGYSRFLKVYCEKCNGLLALYQKDGSGPLKRMYLDRIFSPKSLVGLENIPFKKLPNLTCKKCGQIVGIPFLYKKERRLSFRLFEGSVTKKVLKAK